MAGSFFVGRFLKMVSANSRVVSETRKFDKWRNYLDFCAIIKKVAQIFEKMRNNSKTGAIIIDEVQ
ncbi:hypothetical protein ACQ0QQ_08775 [Lysinibacillus sphaericus]